jgi:hypothetical protein
MKQTNSKNFTSVLKNIEKAFESASKEEKKIWIDWLNDSLNNLLYEDFFGTEGQNDPRGDQRDAQ